MLDALKFAFEILIVGALALPWLAVLHRMFAPKTPSGVYSFFSVIPESAREAVTIAVVVAFFYVIGSAVSRFSRDFFNDELWKPLPIEDVIRDSVYHAEFCSEHAFIYQYWSEPIHLAPPPNFCPSPSPTGKSTDLKPGGATTFGRLTKDQRRAFDENVQEVFRLQESELLLQGVDKVDRLKQYYDQVTVLRGAAFNGFILFCLSLFGTLGTMRARWSSHRFLKLLPLLPAGTVVVLAVLQATEHWRSALESAYSDPPLAELVFLLLGVAGLFATFEAEAVPTYLHICVIAAVVTVISYGGWWWTEVMYDLQVIHSLPELLVQQKNNSAETPPTKPSSSSRSPQSPLGVHVVPDAIVPVNTTPAQVVTTAPSPAPR
jgi:hypothetical protein